jgi:hypothetical protein
MISRLFTVLALALVALASAAPADHDGPYGMVAGVYGDVADEISPYGDVDGELVDEDGPDMEFRKAEVCICWHTSTSSNRMRNE